MDGGRGQGGGRAGGGTGIVVKGFPPSSWNLSNECSSDDSIASTLYAVTVCNNSLSSIVNPHANTPSSITPRSMALYSPCFCATSRCNSTHLCGSSTIVAAFVALLYRRSVSMSATSAYKVLRSWK